MEIKCSPFSELTALAKFEAKHRCAMDDDVVVLLLFSRALWEFKRERPMANILCWKEVTRIIIMIITGATVADGTAVSMVQLHRSDSFLDTVRVVDPSISLGY